MRFPSSEVSLNSVSAPPSSETFTAESIIVGSWIMPWTAARRCPSAAWPAEGGGAPPPPPRPRPGGGGGAPPPASGQRVRVLADLATVGLEHAGGELGVAHLVPGL